MEKFALFDTNMTVATDAKDISGYVAESIRNIYGIIAEVNLGSYPGLTSKEVATEVLRKYGLSEDEISERLDRYLEDLPYSYFNVAWSDRISVADGAKQLLDELKRKEVKIGIATGEPQRVSKMRLEKTGLLPYFTFGSYAEDGMLPKEIIESALNKVSSEFGLQASDGFFISSFPRFIHAAKEASIYSIGVSGIYSATELLASGADEVIKSLKEKPKAVQKI